VAASPPDPADITDADEVEVRFFSLTACGKVLFLPHLICSVMEKFVPTDLADTNLDGLYLNEEQVKSTPKDQLIQLCIRLGLAYRNKNRIYQVATLRKNVNAYFRNMSLATRDDSHHAQSGEVAATSAAAAAAPSAAAEAAAPSGDNSQDLTQFVDEAIHDWIQENRGGRWPPTMGSLTAAELYSPSQHLWDLVDQEMFNIMLSQFVSNRRNHALLKQLGFSGVPKAAD